MSQLYLSEIVKLSIMFRRFNKREGNFKKAFFLNHSVYMLTLPLLKRKLQTSYFDLVRLTLSWYSENLVPCFLANAA